MAHGRLAPEQNAAIQRYGHPVAQPTVNPMSYQANPGWTPEQHQRALDFYNTGGHPERIQDRLDMLDESGGGGMGGGKGTGGLDQDFSDFDPVWHQLGYDSKDAWRQAGKPGLNDGIRGSGGPFSIPNDQVFPSLFAMERAQGLSGLGTGGWTRDASGNTVMSPYTPWGGNAYTGGGTQGWPRNLWSSNPTLRPTQI